MCKICLLQHGITPKALLLIAVLFVANLLPIELIMMNLRTVMLKGHKINPKWKMSSCIKKAMSAKQSCL